MSTPRISFPTGGKSGNFSRSEIDAWVHHRLPKAKLQGDEWRAPCPLHHGTGYNFALNADTGLFKCHSECQREGNLGQLEAQMSGVDYAEALRTVREIAGSGNGHYEQASASSRRIVEEYDYCDEQGKRLFQVVRYEPKAFSQRHPDGHGGWLWNLEGVRRVLYRLNKVVDAPMVFVTEGEKDVHTLEGLGFVGTTNAMGALSWRSEYSQQLRGKEVVIIPDNDDKGLAHALKVQEELRPAVSSVRIVYVPDCKDISEWVEQGGDAAAFVKLLEEKPGEQPTAEAEPEVKQEEASRPRQRQRVAEPEEEEEEEESTILRHWPESLGKEAHYGLAGEFVKLIEPTSESDPAALLLQFLIAFGNLTRGAYFRAEADRHYTNLFCVIVGRTAKGRKGTSLGHVRHVMNAIDPGWYSDCVRSGLSTGEGLISELNRKERNEDKRLLVIEAEFAKVLAVIEREATTLSAVLRDAWDTGHLASMTKTNAASVENAHVSMIAHITQTELREKLTTTQAANGFGNRYLWVCSHRSKVLAEPVTSKNTADFNRQMRAVLGTTRKTGAIEMVRDAEARILWKEKYPVLSEGQDGLFGHVTSRAEAQVMRLSCLYALLDQSVLVRKEHLEAALAVWKYCEDSARFIFGSVTGNPKADRLMKELKVRPEGMTRNDVRELFGRNLSKEEITVIKSQLLEAGRIRVIIELTGERGRPVERWLSL